MIPPQTLARIRGLVPGWLLAAVHSGIVLHGGLRYLRTGSTPEAAYQSMIGLFCRTRGWSNDLLHACVQSACPPYRLPAARGVLGDLDAGEVRRAVRVVCEQGFYVFPQRLPEDLCDRLEDYARTTPCWPFPAKGTARPCLYDGKRPAAPNYRFREADLLGNPDVQGLMADLSLLAVAQAYLGSQPLLDIVLMWWSPAFAKEADVEAAQLYHFDMDRIKWLKFFFYLTDVTPQTGPHCFVAGSHRRYRQPAALLRRGYARIPDEDMARHYPASAFVEITGPRGSIVAVDTRGFHKGKPPESGERLVLQLEFCNALFGGAYQRPRLPLAHPRLRELAVAYPRIYSKFVLDGR
jgi:hypothetical protein